MAGVKQGNLAIHPGFRDTEQGWAGGRARSTVDPRLVHNRLPNAQNKLRFLRILFVYLQDFDEKPKETVYTLTKSVLARTVSMLLSLGICSCDVRKETEPYYQHFSFLAIFLGFRTRKLKS